MTKEFISMPEGPSKHSVVFAKVPGWAQLLNHSWTLPHSK